MISYDDDAKRQKKEDVKKWNDKIDAVRKYDAPALKEYAKNRRIARGDSGHNISVNIVGVYIDILKSFLYAKNPDLDIRKKKKIALEPSQMRELAKMLADQDETIDQAADDAAAQAMELGGEQVAQQMRDQVYNEVRMAAEKRYLKTIKDREEQTNKDLKIFALTIDTVVSELWMRANLKRRAKSMLASSLTTGAGWLKAVWLESKKEDPAIIRKIRDLQDNINRISQIDSDMIDASDDDKASLLAEQQRQIEALQANTEIVVSRAYSIESPTPENIVVPIGYHISDYLDAPWICEISYPSIADACAKYKINNDDRAKIVKYHPKDVTMMINESVGYLVGVKDVQASEADQYSKTQESDTKSVDLCMLKEVWNKEENNYFVIIDGMECYALEHTQAISTSRFYPFFGYFIGEVDSQRHPQSHVARSQKVVDEIDRMVSAEAEARRSVIPGLIFDATALTPESVTKITGSRIGDNTSVDKVDPDRAMNTIFFPKPNITIDYNLYDTSRQEAKVQQIFGIQEALSQSVSVAKTAAEANIQQTGFETRTSFMRDDLDTVLTELAEYSAEVAHAKMDEEEVKEIAGDRAVWPKYEGPQSLKKLLEVSVKASSSGKPRTSMERETWMQFMPIAQQQLETIGVARNSLPEDMADVHEKLLSMTSKRLGEDFDLNEMLPPAGPAPQPQQLPINPEVI
jgi:hypothetical protein